MSVSKALAHKTVYTMIKVHGKGSTSPCATKRTTALQCICISLNLLIPLVYLNIHSNIFSSTTVSMKFRVNPQEVQVYTYACIYDLI